MPSADWCIRGIVLLCYIVPLLATFIACPFVADITAMRDPCFLSMTSIGLVLVALFLFLSVHALAFVLQGRGVVAFITITVYAGLCFVSPLPMLPGPYHALDFVFPPRAFAALLYMQDNFDAAAHCAWTYDSTALKAYMSLVCWCACCVVTILYQTHHDVLVRFFSTTASREQQPTVLPIDTDADVANEHERVSQLLAPAAPIPAADHDSSPAVVEAIAVQFQPDHYIVRDLQKTYWKSSNSCDAGCCCGEDKRAVRSLSFGVRQGECFGLLGPNGAGKTTTIQLMLRELLPDAGELAVQYSPLPPSTLPPSRSEMNRHYRFGVCRQDDDDNVFAHLTAEENMHALLSLRLAGRYRREHWERYVQRVLAKMKLTDHEGKPAEKLSGGMRRRLSACAALFTGRLFIFLDEPSRAVDPVARRALWRCIHEVLDDNRAVLLTTHSTEEAEAVCGRIGIMMEGSLRCLGSNQHLKSRFGFRLRGDPVAAANTRNCR
jgi:ABC-type multidrug transport system ATPase subunit